MLLLRRLAGAARRRGLAARGLASGAPREAADAVVVGAGVVGLAVARALAMAGREVVVVEAGPSFGTGTSSRNSEVIHAGIYYPPRSLKADAENLGTTISYNTAVIGGQVGYEGLELHICESKELQNHPVGSHVTPQLVLLPKLLINSAGLSAVPLAKQFHGLDQAFVPNPHYARGCYFTLSQTKSPFSHLIYPLPEDGGIGVHVTIDLNGQVRFGPDVEWLDGGEDPVSCFLNRFDYSVNPTRCSVFYPVVRKYFPNLKDGSLEPGYSGIRPKLSGPGQPPSDFVIQGQDIHGITGLVNLFGIESPGLTSSLSIAEHIVSRYL
uniref:L-2-hydroxyglutarate dehydrogenase, mitochondrial n=1 Tax=Setaria viridis TaxID=4556 RepID=A0A4U6V106_SETVI|nr:hypothetical protein SEVIR_5G359500v2 [Setaria viridis]